MSPLPDPENIRAQFEQIAKSACLEVILPKFSDFDATAFLKTGSIEDIRQVPSRRNLFLDERARVVLVLKTSTTQDKVRPLLQSLKITLAAHATDAVFQTEGSSAVSASGKHDLTSKARNADEDVELMTAGDNTFVVWKLDLHLSRPKVRLQRPAVYFTANVTMKPENLGHDRKSGSRYLQAYKPLPSNVLAPLLFDPALRESDIYMSEKRLTKVAPTARIDDVIKPIRGTSRRAFPTVPMLYTRIRYSLLSHAVLASLHIEVSQIVPGEVEIEAIELKSLHHTLESVNAAAWPKQARAGDELVSVFRITPQEGIGVMQDTVSISISAAVKLDKDTSISLHITWQAHVDLSAAMSKPMYKWSRPISTSSLQHARLSSQTSSRPASSSSAASHPSSFSDRGIILHITGPSKVQAESTFALAVHCSNHSTRLRRFALVFLAATKTRQQQQPPLPPTAAAGASPQPPSHHHSDKSNVLNSFSTASTTPQLEPPKSPDVLDMNPDVRIGPLSPGECYETQLRFRAVALGVLELGTLRLVDLETRQSVEVKELPDVIAVAAGQRDAGEEINAD
nr:hypothetical protein CFP56_62503 [Quercus suber]